GNPNSTSPTNSGSFSNGVWVGSMTALAAGSKVQVTADDRGGHSSSSNPFDVFAAGDVMLSISDSPDPVAKNSAITYTLVVFNPGPWPATDVTVSNLLPAGVTFTSATSSQGACARVGSLLTCNLGTIEATSN